MKKKIKRYLVFTPFAYRIAVFLVMPVLLAGIGVYTGSRWGEPGLFPVGIFLTMAEIISDNWLFSGLQAKEAEKMDFLKTSGLGMEILRDALILDLLRKFLTAWVILTFCDLLLNISGSLLYIVLISYAFSVLGTFLARYGGLLGISIMVGDLSIIPVTVCLIGVCFSGLKRYIFWTDLFFLIFGILISVLAVAKAMQKVKGGCYDQ